MDDNKNNSSLPDLSGIFNVNDSDIPSKLLEKPENLRRSSPQTDSSGVIFTDKPTKEQQLKQQQTVRRRGNAAKKRRLRRRRTIIAAAAVIAVFALIFAVKTAIANSKRPEVELYTVTVGDVRRTYDSVAAVITASTGGGPISTYAIIPENSYDLNNIKTGQSAIITGTGDKKYEAHVTGIAEEDADTALTETVKTVLTEKTFSAASNIFIYVKPDAPMNEADGTVLTVSITTAEELNVPFVPSECISTDKNGDYVWAVGKLSKKLTKKYVTKALTANGMTAIIGGLKKNEKVVLKAVTDTAERPLADGVKIKASAAQIGEETTTQ